jgi:hypothetical protein
MNKHQTITGFVAVVLVAAVATAGAATMRSTASSAHLITAPHGIMLNELTVDVNKLPTEEFDDQSFVFSAGTKR